MTKLKKASYISTLGLGVLSIVLAILLSNFGIINRFSQGIMIMICINIILAISLNITVGCLGQINLGHAGFMSIGAYAAALFTKSGLISGLPAYFLALLIGGLVAGLAGFLIGIPALRLKGDYLAIVTLAFGEIIRVLIEFFDFTGGAQGLVGIKKFNNLPLIIGITLVSVTLMYSIMTSRHGRAVLAIREDEIAAEATGVNVTFYKTFAFTLSAIFAGVAGAIYAHYMGIVTADQFDFNYSVSILVMVVLGGMGSFTGASLAAVVLTLLPEALRAFADWRMIIYSLVLILMMIFRPSGLLGRAEFSISKVLARWFPGLKEDGVKS